MSTAPASNAQSPLPVPRVHPDPIASVAGVSTAVFAAVAVVAAWSSQALAPALPGSATGIAALINVTTFVAACTSQLVAAGGIALCLRALGGLWPWPNLGVAFRLVIFPVTLAVVAITVTSAAQPLEPEFGRFAAVAAIVAGASSAPLLWSSQRTRSVGIVILLAALGAVFDFSAYEVARRTLGASRMGSTLAALGLFFDAAAALWALAWATGSGKRIPGTVLAAVAVAFGIALVASQATGPLAANGALVVLRRSLDALSERPMLALPAVASNALSILPLVLAAVVLAVPGRQTELRAALTLCLLGRTTTGAPVAALLTVSSVLTALAAWLYGAMPQKKADQRAAKTGSAPSTTTR